MRTFILFSKNATTSPHINDLKKAGRIDILLHSIISSLFISNKFREDTTLHLILAGPPNPPKHISITYDPESTISKKNLKKIIELSLRKAKPGKTVNIHPGVHVNNLGLTELLETYKDRKIFFLDPYGSFIREHGEKLRDSVFVLGDHEGLDKQSKKHLKKNFSRISLGQETYFTSQSITIINYEIDVLEKNA